MSTNALRVILLGKTGCGKSSFANSLTDSDHFKVGRGMRSQTLDCDWVHFVRNGTTMEVIDTPGLCDTHHDQEVIYREVGKSVAVASPGPHIILLALRCDRRFTDEEYRAYTKLKELFSEEMIKYLIVIFNGMDALADTPAQQATALQEEISKMTGNLQAVLRDANNRYIGMNNKADDETKSRLVDNVVTLMKQTVTSNGGMDKFYTTRLIYDVNSMIEGLMKAREKDATVSRSTMLHDFKRALVEEKEKQALKQLHDLVFGLRSEATLMTICAQQ